MNILQELEAFISEFNNSNDEDFSIDTIRIEFSKQHKLEELKKLGNWNKVAKNSPLMPKLRKRLLNNEITSAWRLEEENIYYYNMQDAPKYRRATLIIFGMKQYDKTTPSKDRISNILQIMKDVTSVDICVDLPYKPNIEVLKKCFTLTRYKKQIASETHYINHTDVLMLDKIIFYDKAQKDKLEGILWRIEATISIPNFRALALPLYEFKQIVDKARR